MGKCDAGGKTRWFYTGNQVGWRNLVGLQNFVAGGLAGSGISAGTLVPVFFPPPGSRTPWENRDAVLNQKLLDASFPFISLNWIAEIHIDQEVFRVSNKSMYVEDSNKRPRFYEARVLRGPMISVSMGEWMNPNLEISDMRLTINNRDGFFNRLLPGGIDYKSWTSSLVDIRIGFGEKFENYFSIFQGFVSAKRGVETSETDIILRCSDRFEADEVPIPGTYFTDLYFPYIEENANGKPVPLVYGDWTLEAGLYGEIPAYCINALEPTPLYYEFKISQNSLQEISGVFLSRGNRSVENHDGPIQFNDLAITKDADNGRFLVPAGVPVFDEFSIVLDRAQAGAGSGFNLIAADSINFVERGIGVGDVVVKSSTSEQAVVTGVANFQLTLSGGISFAEKDEFTVQTKYYRFLQNDRISVLCKGKKLNTISVYRLSDAGLGTAAPVGLSVALDGTYWFADNSVSKIYHLDFYGNIINEIEYAEIDASITNVSGVVIQTDNTLWIFEKAQSKIYRFLVEERATGLSFTTAQVSGIGALLANVSGIAIDTANYLYFTNISTGTFYVVNPFAPIQPTVIFSWNRSAFDAAATESLDLSADVNLNQLIVVDRQTLKKYRINQTTGALISSELLSGISSDVTWPVGVSIAQDGTIFVLNRFDLSLYNYNELPEASDNPGFIAKDLIVSMTGRVPTDFDLLWNDTCRDYLNVFKSRCYIAEKTNPIDYSAKLLQQYSCGIYLKYGKYSLHPIEFDYFRDDGEIIREGDIRENSFKVKKEPNQYFNTASCDYKTRPFTGKKTTSDTYMSLTGISFAGREITRKLQLANVYRRVDVDKLMPTFVRLAAADPEFVEVETGWRQLFFQSMDFFRINFYDAADCITGIKRGGRRFDMIPAFVRAMDFDLDKMSIKWKLWSLGTTAFGAYIPTGPYSGGDGDKVVLSSLGTVGYVSPVGHAITGSTIMSARLSDVDGMDAETRTASGIGLAWKAGYKVDIIDAATMNILATRTIDFVFGQDVTFDEALSFVPDVTIFNDAGFAVSGHFLQHSNFDESTNDQRDIYAHLGLPEVGYPASSSEEIEEQRAGLHNFDNNRLPYLLFPEAYTP